MDNMVELLCLFFYEKKKYLISVFSPNTSIASIFLCWFSVGNSRCRHEYERAKWAVENRRRQTRGTVHFFKQCTIFVENHTLET